MITIVSENSVYAFDRVSYARFDLESFTLSIRCDGETFKFEFPHLAGGKVRFNYDIEIVEELYLGDDAHDSCPAIKTKDEESDEYFDYIHALRNLPLQIARACK